MSEAEIQAYITTAARNMRKFVDDEAEKFGVSPAEVQEAIDKVLLRINGERVFSKPI